MSSVSFISVIICRVVLHSFVKEDLLFLLARYVRLELLEGVVAYHTGQNDKALNALKSAHAKLLQVSEWCMYTLVNSLLLIVFNCYGVKYLLLWIVMQLQIPDETLSVVMGMGFHEKDAKRALRLNNKDIATSVDFLIEERAKRAQKHKDDLQRQKEILYV